MTEQKPEQTGDNPNKAGEGPNKGDLQRGDIRWVTLPPNTVERDGKLVAKDEERERVNAEGFDATATPRSLSKGQARDLARRIRAKLGKKG